MTLGLDHSGTRAKHPGKLGFRLAGRRLPLYVGAGFVLIGFLTAIFYAIVMDIEDQYRGPEQFAPIDTSALRKPTAFIGVISRYPPTVMYRGYQPIMDYLTANTPYRFELLLGNDYNEAVDYLLTRRASAVFIGSFQYVKTHAHHGIVPILKPLNENGDPLSRSVLIVRQASPIRAVGDLAGKRLALPSAESFSANWPERDLFPRSGLRTGELRGIQNFSHHHSVIAQVLSGAFDAGVTREYLVKDLLGGALRAVAYSDPIPSSPIVVLQGHDEDIVRAMRTALLAVNRSRPDLAVITRTWDGEFVNGFVEANDGDYDLIRKLLLPAADRGGVR
jgi:phosphonate transport system substrate-binding protein